MHRNYETQGGPASWNQSGPAARTSTGCRGSAPSAPPAQGTLAERAAAAAILGCEGDLSPRHSTALPPWGRCMSSAGGSFPFPVSQQLTACETPAHFSSKIQGGDEQPHRIPPAPSQPHVLTPSTSWDATCPAAASVPHTPPQPPLPTHALTLMQGMTEPVPSARPRSRHRHDRAAPARHRAEPPRSRSRPGSCGSAKAGGEHAAGSDDPTASTCPTAPSPAPGRGVMDCDSALSSGMALLSPFLSVLCSGDRGLTGSFQSSDLSQ